jgi:hypothetical protein
MRFRIPQLLVLACLLALVICQPLAYPNFADQSSDGGNATSVTSLWVTETLTSDDPKESLAQFSWEQPIDLNFGSYLPSPLRRANQTNDFRKAAKIRELTRVYLI